MTCATLPCSYIVRTFQKPISVVVFALTAPVVMTWARPKIVTLTWWGCMRAPMSPRAMLAGPLEVLVGTPMPDRPKVRGQTKSNLPALQVWGFCIGLTTLSCKKLLLRKQQRVTYKNHLCRKSLRNPCHGQQ